MASAQPSLSPCDSVSLPHLLALSLALCQSAAFLIRTILSSGDLRTVDKAQEEAKPGHQDQKGQRDQRKQQKQEVQDPQTLGDLISQDFLFYHLKKRFPKVTFIGEEEEEGEQAKRRDDRKRRQQEAGQAGRAPQEEEDEEDQSPNFVFGDFDYQKFRDNWTFSPSACGKGLEALSSSSAVPSSLTSLPASSLCVFLDPLDGTKEYSLGCLEGVTILLGVCAFSRPVGGIVYSPFSQKGFWGIHDEQSGFKAHNVEREERQKEHEKDQEQQKHELVITTSRSHFSPLLSSLLSRFAPFQLIRSGGAGSKTLFVLQGKADVYFYPSSGTKKWDSCACEALVLACGGSFSDAFGRPIEYDLQKLEGHFLNETGILATREGHQRFVLSEEDRKLLEEERKTRR